MPKSIFFHTTVPFASGCDLSAFELDSHAGTLDKLRVVFNCERMEKWFAVAGYRGYLDEVLNWEMISPDFMEREIFCLCPVLT